MLEERKKNNTKWSHGLEPIPSILWQKEGLYGVLGNKNVSYSTPRPRFSEPKRFIPRNKFQCYNCNSLDHLLKDYKKPRKMMQNANEIVKEILNKVQTVLFETCQQFNEEPDREI